MVGATPSQSELAETRTDAELIAEIAPAMLIKLREDGASKAGYFGTVLFFAWLMLSNLHGRTAGVDQTQYSESVSALYRWAPLLLLLAAIGLIFYFRRQSVAVEVRYRRQHGKWRWER